MDSLTPEKALSYLKEAAEEGYDVSQIELARAYYKEKLGKKDLEKTHHWFMNAAQQGNTDALIYTAKDYFSGLGVSEDDAKGFE